MSLGKKYNILFSVQVWEGDYNIYCMRNDFHTTEICSIGGYEKLTEAIDEIIRLLKVKKIIKQ